MTDNVVPIKKSERFEVYRAEVLKNGEVLEREQLGLAFLKAGARMFRLNLWMFPNEQYFIAANEDRTAYKVLCPNEYKGKNDLPNKHWNEVGSGSLSGSLSGSFIQLKLHLLDQEILIRLFPKASEPEVSNAA